MAWQENRGKSKQLSAMAKVRAKESGIPFSLALMEICREHPDLAVDARHEVLGTSKKRESLGNGSVVTVIGPAEQIAQLAAARCGAKDIPYAVALSEIKREYPDLAHAAREQVLGVEVQKS